MKIKKMCAKMLLNVSKEMIKAGTASWLSAGVEKMPESMKKSR